MNYQVAEAYAQAKYFKNTKPLLQLVGKDNKSYHQVCTWLGESAIEVDKMFAEWIKDGGKVAVLTDVYFLYSSRVRRISQFLNKPVKLQNNPDIELVMHPHQIIFDRDRTLLLAVGSLKGTQKLMDYAEKHNYSVIDERY